MTAGDLAAIIVALAGVVGVGLLLLAVSSLLATLRTLRDAIEALRLNAVPAVAELRRAAEAANAELERVDHLLDTAESVSATLDSASRLTYLVVSNPLIKFVAVAAGTGRAVRRFRRRS